MAVFGMRFGLVLAVSALTALVALPARAELDIQEISTPGGIDLWLVEDHSIPFVALELRFKGGASLDSAEKNGASYLMMGLLEEGAGELDSRGFARAVESIAASFSYKIYDDSTAISAQFLTENRSDAVALLRDSIINPTFDPAAIERVRAQVISSLQSDEKDPDEIAGRTLDQLIYGDHPYGRQKEGTLETVRALTRDDLVAAHQGALTRERMYVAAVGDITAEELSALVDGLLGDLPATGPALAGPVEPVLTEGITIVDFETPQSVALFVQPGIDRDDPDFFAAYVLNVTLGGGGFESRLMTEVREKRGLTYGVYSYLVDKDQADLWMGSVASANDRIAQAIDVIRDEWVKMRDIGVTAQELQDAKTYLTGAYPLRFDGNGPIANIMVGMQMQGLGVDYIDTRNDRVNAVTQEDVNRVAKRLLDPSQMRFVVVGQPEGLTQ